MRRVRSEKAGVHASNKNRIPFSGDSASRMGRKRLGVSELRWQAHELTISDSLYQLTPHLEYPSQRRYAGIAVHTDIALRVNG
jgi:hypothetical protein